MGWELLDTREYTRVEGEIYNIIILAWLAVSAEYYYIIIIIIIPLPPSFIPL